MTSLPLQPENRSPAPPPAAGSAAAADASRAADPAPVGGPKFRFSAVMTAHALLLAAGAFCLPWTPRDQVEEVYSAVWWIIFISWIWAWPGLWYFGYFRRTERMLFCFGSLPCAVLLALHVHHPLT